jgi:hypothetical protein
MNRFLWELVGDVGRVGLRLRAGGARLGQVGRGIDVVRF